MQRSLETRYYVQPSGKTERQARETREGQRQKKKHVKSRLCCPHKKQTAPVLDGPLPNQNNFYDRPPAGSGVRARGAGGSVGGSQRRPGGARYVLFTGPVLLGLFCCHFLYLSRFDEGCVVLGTLPPPPPQALPTGLPLRGVCARTGRDVMRRCDPRSLIFPAQPMRSNPSGTGSP